MLTDFQRVVAKRFLAMPEAEGFALAGGAALILHEVVTRRTRDLDLFADDLAAVRAASDAFLALASAQRWRIEVIRSGPAFMRATVANATGDSVLVDVGYDHRWLPAVPSAIGPVLSVEELAVDKLLALFGRAEARDFVDTYHLAKALGTDAILGNAHKKDSGFDPYHLAVNLGSLGRHPREAFEVDDDTFAEMTAFFAALRADLLDAALDES